MATQPGIKSKLSKAVIALIIAQKVIDAEPEEETSEED